MRIKVEAFFGVVFFIFFVILYKIWKIRLFTLLAKKMMADSSLELNIRVSEIFKNTFGSYPSLEERDAFLEESQRLLSAQITSTNRFIHMPSGPETTMLPKYFGSREMSKTAILPHLEDFEIYIWDGVYNTKDARLAYSQFGQSLGRLYVTNQRLLFWPDKSTKPYRAVYWLDIEKVNKIRLPLTTNLFGFEILSSDKKAIFATTRIVARQIKPFLDQIAKN